MGSVDGLRLIVAQATVRPYDRVPVHPFLSVAWIANVKVPDDVGVPERTPLEESVNPGGRLPLMTMNE